MWPMLGDCASLSLPHTPLVDMAFKVLICKTQSKSADASVYIYSLKMESRSDAYCSAGPPDVDGNRNCVGGRRIVSGASFTRVTLRIICGASGLY